MAYKHDMDMSPLDDLELQAQSKVKVDAKPGVIDEKEAILGRKELDIAEVEMPGLMSTREEGKDLPLKGANITGSLHMTIQTAVLIETLQDLGANVRWASCNIFSTQDHASAAVAKGRKGKDPSAVYAWKFETLPWYWWCTYQACRWPSTESGGPDMIVDDGGDATMLVHAGVDAEKAFNEKGTVPDLNDATSDDEYCLYYLLRNTLKIDSNMWTKIAAKIVGVSEETTTGVKRLREMAAAKKLLFPAINVNDAVTKSKFDNVYGCRHSLPDGIMRATDVMIAGKTVMVAGYGDVGKGSAQAMKACGARVIVAEIDPICALQACMEGFQVGTLEDHIKEIDMIITTTGNCDIVMAEDMAKMKNNCIVGNIGHFDNEIDMKGLMSYKDIERVNLKPGTDRWVFPDGHGVIVLAEGRLLNLGCATGHPSFVMSCSFTNQAMAQIELWKGKKTNKYGNDLYLIPKHLDEKVARLHLKSLGAKLTKLSKTQQTYLKMGEQGPYKPETYRY